ncbi:MAG: GNAT family N-acetyltransferase [Candidatus Doudnabacteria bacterium]|nr:GNAT family N-acetyltransferase [Candidatus Doudnabacteria bacterium]
MDITSERIEKDIYGIKISALDGGKVVGWTQLYIIRNERHDEPYAFLENLYIEEEYRSQGLGTQLVQAAIGEAKKLDCYKIIGTSRSFKEGVHKFYLKNGFTNWGYEFRMDLKESKSKQQD